MFISSTAKQIVIEIGSAYIRAGFAGEASPRCIVRCVVNFTETADRSALDLQLHELLHEIFVDRLHIKPKMCSVLVIEKLLGTKLLRDSVFTLLFKVFQVTLWTIQTHAVPLAPDNPRYDTINACIQVQAVSIQPDLYMDLIPSGQYTGVVLNVGESECQSMCFAFGKPLIHTLRGTICASISSHKLASFFYNLCGVNKLLVWEYCMLKGTSITQYCSRLITTPVTWPPMRLISYSNDSLAVLRRPSLKLLIPLASPVHQLHRQRTLMM